MMRMYNYGRVPNTIGSWLIVLSITEWVRSEPNFDVDSWFFIHCTRFLTMPRSPPTLHQSYASFPIPSRVPCPFHYLTKKMGSWWPSVRPPFSLSPTPPSFPPSYLSKPLCPFISPSTGRIWLDNLSCSGTEHSVTECASRGWGNSDCTHDEDAGIICKDQRIPGFPDSNVIEVCSAHTHTHTHTPARMARQRGLWGVICG